MGVKIKKIILFLVIAVFLPGAVYAAECNSTPTNGCTISRDTTFVPGTYYLPDGISFKSGGSSSVVYKTLDCNGATLIGNGAGTGILMRPQSKGHMKWNTVKNCNIQNYSYGIWILSYLGYSLNHVMENDIYNNTFRGNDFGIHIHAQGHDHNRFWDNDFYDSGIFYSYTNNNNYCVDGVGNNYYNGTTGPTCSGMYPYDGLRINSNTVFAPGTYYLPGGISFNSGSTGSVSHKTLDCNGAILIGSGTGNGILMRAKRSYMEGNTIKNCNIQNYSSGIMLLYYHEDKVYYVFNNNITNSTFKNNDYGIYNFGKREGNSVSYCKIYGNTDYALYNRDAFNLTAENNWWGAADEYKIKDKICDCEDDSSKGCVDYVPWLTEGPKEIIDLSISPSDISFHHTSNMNISVRIHNNGNSNVRNIQLMFIDSYNGQFIKEKTEIFSEKIIAGTSKVLSTAWNIEKEHDILVIVDPNNNIEETDKSNNIASKKYKGLMKIYAKTELLPEVADEEIHSFITEKLDSILSQEYCVV